ncbi:hypothetical protein [Rhizobium sp. RCC_161_2]|uniref:hypothetical protein n=1 Tax=Rhizobium sp. RCC_161_2 TaxID=3239219 RepID=UPI0035260124
MAAIVEEPREKFPEVGDVANPAIFFDGEDVFLCYQISPRGGGGNAVVKFGDVFEFQVKPMNVEGLGQCRYPVRPWSFNEIINAEEILRWRVLKPRFWMISFNDVMVEVLFESAALLLHDLQPVHPKTTLTKIFQ